MRKWLLIGFTTLCGVVNFFSCKEPVIEGSDVYPEDQDVHPAFTDTFTIKAQTVREDSLRTDDLDLYSLGGMDDPTFGKTCASLFFQVLLPANNVNLGDQLNLDSAVLSFDYDGSYGDISITQRFTVYETTEAMHSDSSYYSNTQFQVNGTPIGQFDAVPNLTDSVQLKEGKERAHLRLRLDSAFGEQLLQQSGTANFADNSAFLDFLKGFWVTVDTTAGIGKGLLYLDMLSSLSRLTIYYRNSNDSALSYDFPITASSVIVNHFHHNYQGSVVAPYINGTTPDDSLLFLQPLAGLKTFIEIPQLVQLERVGIGRAELLIRQADDPSAAEQTYSLPLQLNLKKVGPNGQDSISLEKIEGATYFGGDKSNGADSHGQSISVYKFNITRYVQKVINGELNDHGFYLVVRPSNEIANRLVIGGGNHSLRNMKLRITFIEIN